MKRNLLFALMLCAACSSTSTEASGNPIVTVNGPLTLTVQDTPTSMESTGIFWALPNVQPGPGTVTVTNTRYGSLCLFAVTGVAIRAGRQVTLDITYTERLTSCGDQLRALSYKADISVPAGNYDLSVIHHADGRSDTLVHRTIDVP